eukprot:TRINITY_DN6468_c0_g1_i4.p1 TRINITY_DN6468_c0_g1~~TRINITY_DN6468_c0_g1_i4.p1  ORF type:complete len:1159 (+),score=144.02 TRINITY_DN6468_c0_g1_i4:48-3479(+)
MAGDVPLVSPANFVDPSKNIGILAACPAVLTAGPSRKPDALGDALGVDALTTPLPLVVGSLKCTERGDPAAIDEVPATETKTRDVSLTDIEVCCVQEGKDSMEIIVDRNELVRNAKKTAIKNACSTFDEQTNAYSFKSLWGTRTSELGEYGSGVMLYFDFLRFLGIVLFVMFLITTPSLVWFAEGSRVRARLDELSASFKTMGRFTIANIGFCEHDCNSFSASARTLRRGSEASIETYAIWVSSLDLVATIVLTLFIFWFQYWWIPKTVAEQDQGNVTPADFAVQIRGLPRNLDAEHGQYAERLSDHFQSVLAHAGIGNSDAVKEVTLSREYDGLINKFLRQGRLLRQIKNADLNLRIARASGDGKAIKRFEKVCSDFDNEIKTIEAILKSSDKKEEARDVCMAFIMFNTEAQKTAILNAFKRSTSWHARAVQAHHLRFAGKRISVQQAPEPDNLCWENLDFHLYQHVARWCLSLSISLSFVFVCVMLLLVSKSNAFPLPVRKDVNLHTLVFRVQPPPVALAKSPEAGCLRSVCVADLFDDPLCTNKMNFSIVNDRGQQPCLCTNGNESLVLHWANSTPRCIRFSSNLDALERLDVYGCSDANTTDPVEDWCTHYNDVGVGAVNPLSPDRACEHEVTLKAAQFAKVTRSTDSDLRIKCFCQQQPSSILMSWLNTNDSPETAVCEQWIRAQNGAMIYNAVGVLSVLVFNVLLRLNFNYVQAWVRYTDIAILSTSQMDFLFTTQLINTAVVALVISISFDVSSGWRMGHVLFDDSWVVIVGGTLITTLLCQIASEIGGVVFCATYGTKIVRRFQTKEVVTQDLMDEAYSFASFQLPCKIASTLTVLTCSVIFSAGVPLLNLLAVMYCFLAYWVYKWILLRYSSKPSAMTETLMVGAVRWFKLGLGLHLALSMLFFSNNDILPSQWSGLVKVFEVLLGMNTIEQAEILRKYETLDDDARLEKQFELYRAKFLGIGRESCFGQLIFVLLYFACLIVAGIVKRLCLTNDDGGIAASTVDDERRKRGAESDLFSYKMQANWRYKVAHEAMFFDDTSVTDANISSLTRLQIQTEKRTNEIWGQLESLADTTEEKMQNLIEDTVAQGAELKASVAHSIEDTVARAGTVARGTVAGIFHKHQASSSSETSLA